jgi:hypothetical protein
MQVEAWNSNEIRSPLFVLNQPKALPSLRRRKSEWRRAAGQRVRAAQPPAGFRGARNPITSCIFIFHTPVTDRFRLEM